VMLDDVPIGTARYADRSRPGARVSLIRIAHRAMSLGARAPDRAGGRASLLRWSRGAPAFLCPPRRAGCVRLTGLAWRPPRPGLGLHLLNLNARACTGATAWG
jgi:hypothetical protein